MAGIGGTFGKEYKVEIVMGKNMFPSQKKILDVLNKKSASSEELIKLTGLSPDGIRGRVSEIRKLGYNIKKIDGKYHLYDDNSDMEKVISYIASHHQYGLKIEISRLMDELDISHEKISDVLSKLYRRKQLFQVTKDTVIIYHL